MLRILIINMVITLACAILGVWVIFEFDLLLVRGPEFMPRRESETKRVRAAGSAAKRAHTPGAIDAHNLTGRSFGRSPLPLSLPVDCEPGADCWVFNYIDADSSKGRADFACGRMTYDGHKGTDIALAHAGRLHERVEVRAAAAGRVIGARDGMRDASVRLLGSAAVEGRECGNGVRIDHGGGWRTQYCHMKRGSVSVRRGDPRSYRRSHRRGRPLGRDGIPAPAHFGRKERKVVDPFVGVDGGAQCDLGVAPLWRREVLEKLRYLSAVPYHAGFADHLPTTEEVRTGALSSNVVSGHGARPRLLGRGGGAHAGRFHIPAPPGASTERCSPEKRNPCANTASASGGRSAGARMTPGRPAITGAR